jgi:adenylate cyclase class 2
VFDDAKRSLRKRGKLIRIRTVGRLSLLTFKGPSEPGKHKKRREIETDLIDADSFEEILKQIGYQASFRYEKFRTEYSKPRVAGIVMLDETPIGNFLEIEGSPTWIDRTARLLGFSSADYITQSYGSLYLKYCRARGVRSRDMLFSRTKRT